MKNIESERRSYPVNTEKLIDNPIMFGISVSNKGNIQNPGFLLPQSLESVINLTESNNSGIELQIEFDEGVTQIPDVSTLRREGHFLGVHLPIIGIDMSQDNPAKTASDQLLFDKAIKMAAELDADYIVCHLQGDLNWDNLHKRNQLIETMKTNTEGIALSIKKHDYTGKLLFENLEFPLYPSTSAEIEVFMDWMGNFEKKYQIQTGFCLDIPHLWHSGIMISDNGWRRELQNLADSFNTSGIPFRVYVNSLFEKIIDKIELVHIAGTKISPNKHDTHLLPAISQSRHDSDRVTLDIASSLQAMYTNARSRGRYIPIINEGHGYSYKDMLRANKSMMNFLDFCYPKKEAVHERIDNPWSYYNNPHVVRSVLAYLGTEGEQWEDAKNIKHAFMGIGHEGKLWRGKNSPVSTVDPKYISHMIDINHGYVELHASLLPSSENNRPSRALIVIDLDRYRMLPDNQGGHNYDQATPILTPQDTFQALEPVINLYQHAFDLLGIPVLVILSGKGVHLVTQVTNIDAIDALAEIGGPVEDSLAGKLADAQRITKAKSPIPEMFQKVHVGVGRLQQMINMYLIKESRNLLAPYFEAEIFNKGFPGREVNGIAFDNAAVMFPVYLKPLSTLGSLYFIKGMKSGLQFPNKSIQIPITGNGYRYRWSDVIHNRNDFSATAAYLGSVDCHIPNAGSLDRLLKLYRQSGIRDLHLVMDSNMGDSPWDWNNTYRKDNYRIINSTSEPKINRKTVDYASAFLGGRGLHFYYIDKLLFQIYQTMGGRLDVAPHVAGFLRSVYEDGSKGWGNTWTGKMDAASYARKLTEQILGQMYEADTGDIWKKIDEL